MLIRQLNVNAFVTVCYLEFFVSTVVPKRTITAGSLLGLVTGGICGAISSLLPPPLPTARPHRGEQPPCVHQQLFPLLF